VAARSVVEAEEDAVADADTSPGTFSPPAPAPQGNQPPDNAFIGQFMQWLQGMAGGGGPSPQMGMGGGIPISPAMLGMGGMGMPDALGLGGGADPLGMGQMLMGGGIGLNPAQAAGLRLRRNNEMNALRQNMANAHRGVGRFGGTDFSRHVQNIDDEILALSEQKVQDNVKNALAYNDQLQKYAQQNVAKNNALIDAMTGAFGRNFKYGGAGSPGTFSGGEDSSDSQDTGQ
jgi:hypothetical protein